MPDANRLWGVASDWRAYLEEVTAGVNDNADARAVREELRAHLEEARQRPMAEEGLDSEDAAREALGRMGAPQTVAAALRARYCVDWARIARAGIAAGVAGAGVFALGLHLLWRVVRSVMTIGDHAVLSGRFVPPPLSLMNELAYAHALAALLVSLLWSAGALAPLVAALISVRRGAGRRPTEFPVAVVAGLTFAIALALIERGVGALNLVQQAPPIFGGGFFGLVADPLLRAIYADSPLAFVALGWGSGPLSLGGGVHVGETYSEAALIAACCAYAARRISRRQAARTPVM